MRQSGKTIAEHKMILEGISKAILNKKEARFLSYSPDGYVMIDIKYVKLDKPLGTGTIRYDHPRSSMIEKMFNHFRKVGSTGIKLGSSDNSNLPRPKLMGGSEIKPVNADFKRWGAPEPYKEPSWKPIILDDTDVGSKKSNEMWDELYPPTPPDDVIKF